MTFFLISDSRDNTQRLRCLAAAIISVIWKPKESQVSLRPFIIESLLRFSEHQIFCSAARAQLWIAANLQSRCVFLVSGGARRLSGKWEEETVQMAEFSSSKKDKLRSRASSCKCFVWCETQRSAWYFWKNKRQIMNSRGGTKFAIIIMFFFKW